MVLIVQPVKVDNSYRDDAQKKKSDVTIRPLVSALCVFHISNRSVQDLNTVESGVQPIRHYIPGEDHWHSVMNESNRLHRLFGEDGKLRSPLLYSINARQEEIFRIAGGNLIFLLL